MGHYIIGIDLGTTHSTLATTRVDSLSIEQVEIEQQLTREGKGKRFLLPSFYYIPLPEEGEEPVVGYYGRERGSEVPDRVIASVKSWLGVEGIDKQVPFLPLGEGELKKRSPVEVSSAYLSHLKQVWEGQYQEPFYDQQIIITVPASFNPEARVLVQEAAREAGYPETMLVEEPLAAFYAWLHIHEKEWRSHLSIGQSLLIIDVGGGTTDFSLISVGSKEGELVLERQAVGNHLLLGGDNLDLALAYWAQQKLGQELDEWQFQQLIHAVREAKEELLGDSPKERVELVLQGRGSSLIANSLYISLERAEVASFLLEGFFPSVPLDISLENSPRSGITKLGLPYVRDPRITAQLASFLRGAKSSLPTALLFNGGVMKAPLFRERLLQLLSSWKGETVTELAKASYDFGVSQGAAYYGWTRQGRGIRVKAGIPRSFYIGVEKSVPAVPGIQPPIKTICVAPFGMEEGSEVSLEEESFNLVLEEPAIFRFFCRLDSQRDRVGSSLVNWKKELQELNPIETTLTAQGEKGKQVKVQLKAKVTELGVLELWCLAGDGRKWKLEFDVRK